MDRVKVLIAVALMVALTLPMFAYLPVATATEISAGNEYVTVKGLLGIDNYPAYYEYKDRHWLHKPVDVGFSKWGEVISEATHPHAPVGIEYSLRDPFANDRATPIEYSEGWWISLRYRSYTYGPRYVWAFALYSDLRDYGGDWINNSAGYNVAPYGGRKTNGRAHSKPLEIIYDGPRRFVALAVTDIEDEPLPGIHYPVLHIETLFIFNKNFKTVLLLDTITLKVPVEELGNRVVNCTFARQSKWLIGPWPEFRAYAHVYNATTVYNYSIWGTIENYPYKGGEDGIKIVQLIDRDKDYVGFAAYWPNCTDIAVNATDFWYKDLCYVGETPEDTWGHKSSWSAEPYIFWDDIWDDELHANTEPDIPFVKAQWRFNMSYATWQNFRTATLYGVTDFIQDEKQKADDVDMEPPPHWAGEENRIGNETYWLIVNRTFVPWPDIPAAFCGSKYVHENKIAGETYIEVIANVTSWNWTVIGKDARTTDVAGAAMLVSALDEAGEKAIKEGLTTRGEDVPMFYAILDMEEHTYGPNALYACSRPGAGYMREDYYFTDPEEQVGERVGLMESSGGFISRDFVGTNVTVVGGPYANLVGEYLNDFTVAFALDEPPFDHHWTKIYALTCWARNTYVDEEVGDDTGYAVVATHWDLNGTVFLWVWGWTAEDTMAMCQAIRDNVNFFMGLPAGTTAIIVEIDYVDGTFDVIECLGEVSECEFDEAEIHLA